MEDAFRKLGSVMATMTVERELGTRLMQIVLMSMAKEFVWANICSRLKNTYEKKFFFLVVTLSLSISFEFSHIL